MARTIIVGLRRLAGVVLLTSVGLGACAYGVESTSEGLEAEQKLPSRYPFVVDDALKWCRPTKGLWVDLGAGKGQVAIPLIERTKNPVVMLDPDADAMKEGLELARRRGLADKLSAVVGVAEAMPFPNQSVDLIISRGSIFFWDDPVKGLREVVRVLRPEGKAYIGGGAGSGYPKWATEKLIQQRKQRLRGDNAARWEHFVQMRRPEQLRKWAAAAGLHNVEIMGKGAVSAEDQRVGQGVWLLLNSPSSAPGSR